MTVNMNKLFLSGVASLLFLLSACAVETNVQRGRMALLYGDPLVALASFQNAAKLDPDYLHYSVFPEGIWTYVGRAYYAAARYPEARQALERAVSIHIDDSMAKLYLGLTLARLGERERSSKEIERSFREFLDWFDYAHQYAALTYGPYWDPTKEIRAEIENNLAMLSEKNTDWQKLIVGGEWIGRKIEEEIDIAKRQASQDQYRGDETSGD
jgi:tetratricopeptide (TPR) repeat protein